MTPALQGASHIYLMPLFWSLVNRRRPKWSDAHDRLAQAEIRCGIVAPLRGTLLMHTAQWRQQ